MKVHHEKLLTCTPSYSLLFVLYQYSQIWSLTADLLRLRSEDCPELASYLKPKSSFTSHAVQNEMIKLESMEIMHELVTTIKEHKIFSIMLDGTQDITWWDDTIMADTDIDTLF